MFSSATQPPRGPPPPRHNFAITFEEFKLPSSNLTHALLIQISRSSIIYIVVPSKMAAGGHFVKNNPRKSCVSEMARNSMETYLRTSKMAAGGHFEKKSCVSEMARNAIQSYLRTSKMAAGGHFVKNLKK